MVCFQFLLFDDFFLVNMEFYFLRRKVFHAALSTKFFLYIFVFILHLHLGTDQVNKFYLGNQFSGCSTGRRIHNLNALLSAVLIWYGVITRMPSKKVRRPVTESAI